VPDGPADTTEARERLARAQRELLAALVAGAAHPDGFDPDRLRAQAASLVAKRRDLVARAAPDLVARLGPRFGALFADYARGRPRPAGGSQADARAFALWLGLPGDQDFPRRRPGRLSRLLRRRSPG
jgi:hypothetical protein